MQCDCHTALETKMREKVKSQIPEGARNFTGSLEGYAFILEGNAMVTRPAMPFKVEYEAPKKRGDGFTKKKETVNITANLCPFCGKPTKAEEEAA
jgi:hypothetical protein